MDALEKLHGDLERETFFDLFPSKGVEDRHLVGSILDFYSMISHRTLLIWEMVLTSLTSWISDGLFSLSTIYGIGILNEPHICGPWYDEPLYGPACLQDFYPKAYDVVRNYFPEDVKASVVQSIRMTTHLGGGGHCRQVVFCF